jgi:hypothetical protein
VWSWEGWGVVEKVERRLCVVVGRVERLRGSCMVRVLRFWGVVRWVEWLRGVVGRVERLREFVGRIIRM